jgi:glycosyltransferase involved in cell wall biosynthesis
MKVLVLSSIIPAPLSTKKRENDILFTTYRYHKLINPKIEYFFVYLVPYSNWILSLFSNKWKEYRQLRIKGNFRFQGNIVEVMAVPGIKNDLWIKGFFVLLSVFFYRKKIKRIIKDKNIDLIHAHNVFIDGGIANRLSKTYNIPYVLTTRNIHTVKINKYVSGNLKEASALVSLNFSLKALADEFNMESYLIPHGVDQDFFEMGNHALKNDKLKIVTVSRLLDWKNIDKILISLSNLKFDFEYTIYGEGPEKIRLEQIVSSLGLNDKVEFKGFIPYDKMPETLKKYNLFVLISYPETFGRVFIESMATGVPIVAAKGCGMDGFIKHFESGFLVDHNDEFQLTSLLEEIQNNKTLLNNISSHAKEVAQQFSWIEVAGSIDTLYHKINNTSNK